MKKLLVRLLFVLFMPLIALVIMGQQNNNTGRKIGFWLAIKEMWEQCWGEE